MNEFFDNIPEYGKGVLSPYVYNVGCGMESDLEPDNAADSDCFLRIVSDTNEKEYLEYIKRLKEAGYKIVYENKIGSNLYTELLGDYHLYVYYTAPRGEVRIIIDRCSSLLSSFSYSLPDSKDAQIYQYALFYDPQNGHSPTTTNCGMLFIVRLCDNSLYMYDGGDLLQCSNEAINGMISFMHEITSTQKGEKIRIAAWHISHAHNDHMDGCSKLINRFHDELDIKRFMFNFPSSSVRKPDSRCGTFKETINKYCPDALFIKPHTGQKIRLANASFEVLYTHEDAIRPNLESAYPFRDYNCTSTILKMTVGENSVMWLGDTNTETEETVARNFPTSIWKSDVVQVAHHCFNYLSTLYSYIDAPHAMLPNSYFGAHTPENLPKLDDVLKCLSDPDNISYSDTTSGFAFIDGEYSKILERERVGNDYDFSGF